MNVNHERQPGAADERNWKTAPVDADAMEPFLIHPRDILGDPTLNIETKRSILASWLSDLHAVPGAPRWRQLENGGFVDTWEIWEALYKLDDAQVERPKSEGNDSPDRRQTPLSRWIEGVVRRKRDDDDDDDPPPCPVGIRLPKPPKTDWDPAAGAKLAFAA